MKCIKCGFECASEKLMTRHFDRCKKDISEQSERIDLKKQRIKLETNFFYKVNERLNNGN